MLLFLGGGSKGEGRGGTLNWKRIKIFEFKMLRLTFYLLAFITHPLATLCLITQ